MMGSLAKAMEFASLALYLGLCFSRRACDTFLVMISWQTGRYTIVFLGPIVSSTKRPPASATAAMIMSRIPFLSMMVAVWYRERYCATRQRNMTLPEFRLHPPPRPINTSVLPRVLLPPELFMTVLARMVSRDLWMNYVREGISDERNTVRLQRCTQTRVPNEPLLATGCGRPIFVA